MHKALVYNKKNKYIKTYDMKKIMMIMVLGALIACLVPAAAQNPQEWQSTSAMKGAGSSYSSQITAVGATSALSEATTTDNYSPAKAPGGPRRVIEDNQDFGGDEASPIGDALLPLMLMAMVFTGVIYFRKRRARA